MSHKTDSELIAKTRNVARYFAESRHVAWFVLALTLLVGAFAYVKMPKRKDPFIKVRVAVAICAWPGAPPERVEEQITRKIEERIAQNTEVDKIESSSRTGVSIVTLTLRDELPPESIPKTLDDIDLKLRSIRDLPPGASPVDFQKDFGDTATVMLTVASPKARPVELDVRAEKLREALAKVRGSDGARSSLVLAFPVSVNPVPLRRAAKLFEDFAVQGGSIHDVRTVEGSGFIALDATADGGESTWLMLLARFRSESLSSQFHPEIWKAFAVTQLGDLAGRMRESAGDALSYRELDELTDVIARRLRAAPTVGKVTRNGVLGERVYLDYSQERIAALGITQQSLQEAIAARNVQGAGGTVEAAGRSVIIDPSSTYRTEEDVASTVLTTSATGSVVHVRDVVDVSRDYETPIYLGYHTWRDRSGTFQRSRAITLAVQMRAGEQIALFSSEVDAAVVNLRKGLPEDLILARTSDQPAQVEEKVSLFMTSLYEAVAIIILVGFLGFREWRSTLILSLSIPLTLMLTFVFMWILGIDVQQMSIAALILALGLLVDDPVVAGDAIKRELERGHPRQVAAWLGPTKLAGPIFFATVTNIVAYLPFLLMKGDVGHFIYSLPIVLTASLVASRIVSMTFIPLLGYHLLRPAPVALAAVPRTRTPSAYERLVRWAIVRRYRVLAASLVILACGGFAGSKIRSSFFPQDLAHIFYVDMYLPEDASFRSTSDTAIEVDRVIRATAEEYGKTHNKKKPILESVTTFVGGGAPRFWYSLPPQLRQLNYAQLVINVTDEHDTAKLIAPVQRALTAFIPGARMDVRPLETGKTVLRPIEIRISGEDAGALRRIATTLKEGFRSSGAVERVRDDWGTDSFRLKIDVDPAAANLAGVSNTDVAATSAAGFLGVGIGTLQDGDRLVPIVSRLRYEERANAGKLDDMYVLSRSGSKVPLGQIAKVNLVSDPERIHRRNQRRTITVAAFPAEGLLTLEAAKKLKPLVESTAASLPPGYKLDVGGTEENVIKVRKDSAVVAAVSLLAILLTLVIQFRNVIKSLVVFLATIPFGAAGAMIAIVLLGAPFGFTAILGLISLIGVIVSHIIVLFDYIEEARERGEPLTEALVAAGVQRLRPVMITVGATVLGLLPLALHGGPLWEPLCYVQIGGLTLATAITLLLVPLLYAVLVSDLKWISWSTESSPPASVITWGKTVIMKRPSLRRIAAASQQPPPRGPDSQ